MSTTPASPAPPSTPQPTRSSHILAISLLLLALILVLGVVGVIIGARVLTHAVHLDVGHGDHGKNEVSIKTPIGSLEVNQHVTEAGLGIPIYPGASAIKDEESANVNLNFGDETKLQVLARKFETADSLDKVVDFYHARLGDQVTSFKQKDEEGKTVFEIKHGKQEKIVALQNNGRRTIIELVRVAQGQHESN